MNRAGRLSVDANPRTAPLDILFRGGELSGLGIFAHAANILRRARVMGAAKYTGGLRICLCIFRIRRLSGRL